MKYIIMAGTGYEGDEDAGFECPRHLVKIKGEPLVARTIRLLKENGVDDIAISSNNSVFEQFGVPVLHHANEPDCWANAFYPAAEPVCYLFGDVCYSSAAIKKIVNTSTDDVEFFATAPPFPPEYVKTWTEPLAFKVTNYNHFNKAVAEAKDLYKRGILERCISWEIWQVVKGLRLNFVAFDNYVVINDYSCDIDTPEELKRIEPFVEG